MVAQIPSIAQLQLLPWPLQLIRCPILLQSTLILPASSPLIWFAFIILSTACSILHIILSLRSNPESHVIASGDSHWATETHAKILPWTLLFLYEFIFQISFVSLFCFFFFVCFVSLSMGFSFLSEDVFGLGGEDCCQSLNCLRRSTTSVIPEQEGISPGKGYPTPIPSEVYLADALLPGGQTLMLLLSMCNRYSRTAQQSFPSATSAPNHLQLPQRPPPQINWTLGLCQQASSLISWFLISFHLYPGK